jgi:hypothetical protein
MVNISSIFILCILIHFNSYVGLTCGTSVKILSSYFVVQMAYRTEASFDRWFFLNIFFCVCWNFVNVNIFSYVVKFRVLTKTVITSFDRSQVFSCVVYDGTATMKVVVWNKDLVDLFYPKCEVTSYY